MEIRLTRQEIRRQMRAILGQAEAEATSGNTGSQFDALIDHASLEIHALGSWVGAELRTTLDLTDEQYKVSYPTDCDIGGVLEVAICESDAGATDYRPMEQRPLPVWLDIDQQETAGGATFDRVQGSPCYWQQRAGFIYVWPVNDDTNRKLRVRYNVRKTFATNATVSTVDAMCIIYKALALYLRTIGDEVGERRWLEDLSRRIGLLRSWQDAGHAQDLDSEASFDDRPDPFRQSPNWDTSPARQS